MSNSIKSFFKEFSVINNNYSSGNKNVSIDGTGILPSVDEKAGNAILLYIKKNYPKCKTILDVGAGVGYLSRQSQYMNPDDRINCFSFEGCKDLVQHIKCDPNLFSIVDLTEKFTDNRLEKQFDLTTSFEVLEHVHRMHQDIFWQNLKFLSKAHLCSIHVANQQDHQHCTIRPLNEWLDYLKDKGEVTVLGRWPAEKDNTDIQCDFRKETNLHNWDCSIMLYIKFN